MERPTIKMFIDQCNALDLHGAADCIENLAAEVDRLRPLADEVQAARRVMREHNRMLVELAASQARGEQLRDELFAVLVQDMSGDKARLKVEEFKSDTSALEALIARASEVMRERCAHEADPFELKNALATDIAKGILALPGLTLEDLQK